MGTLDPDTGNIWTVMQPTSSAYTQTNKLQAVCASGLAC